MDELEGVLHGEAPTMDQLDRLPLLDRVIHESLRILPPNPWFVRHVAEPTSLGPYQLEKGTFVVYSPAVTNRNPKLYPRPDRFMPERWETIKPGPYEYIHQTADLCCPELEPPAARPSAVARVSVQAPPAVRGKAAPAAGRSAFPRASTVPLSAGDGGDAPASSRVVLAGGYGDSRGRGCGR